MVGKYVTGTGQAHSCCAPHRKLFGCTMYGTFNVYASTFNILDHSCTIETAKAKYWFVQLEHIKKRYHGWAVRDHTSRQRGNVLEIITKVLLPDSLKEGDIKVTLQTKWSNSEVKKWAEDQYWFQGFPFSPIKKADSQYIWDKILEFNDNVITWAGCSVLDIGTHYGYFAFKASELGANVVGFDTNNKSLNVARTIQNNIILQDVSFVNKDPLTKVDVILYLSVHHQPDPEYKHLAEKITELKSRCKHLFVELIMPPMFPRGSKMTKLDIDMIVRGSVLATYKHNVRGTRRIYQCKGTCDE